MGKLYLRNRDIAIGPFGSEADARAYRRETRIGGKSMPAKHWEIVDEEGIGERKVVVDEGRAQLMTPREYADSIGAS